jgi:hypothetical protein
LENRAHFFAPSARLMRRILVNSPARVSTASVAPARST